MGDRPSKNKGMIKCKSNARHLLNDPMTPGAPEGCIGSIGKPSHNNNNNNNFIKRNWLHPDFC